MYLDFYQLKSKPFQITADPKFLWLGEKHKEALATLRYGIVDNRGFLLLTGEVGTGKTILINRLSNLLDIDTVVATLTDPDLNSMDFYNLLADSLKMNRTFESKGAFLIHMREFLHKSYAEHKQVLLIIDESQRLNHRLMEDIRVLSNIELQDRKLINIFFVGQQEFNSILLTPQNRALAQRITVRYHLEPLNKEETGGYVIHRLKIAGRTKPIFNKAALDEIFYFSGGIPRLINIISDHALLTGYSQGLKRINGSIVRECAEELRIPIPKTDAQVASLKPAGKNEAKGKARQDAGNPAMDETAMPARLPSAEEKSPSSRAPATSLVWILGYALLILGLVAAVSYMITQFSGGQPTRYDVSDLTPQKYKTTLEKEKALLADRLDKNAFSEETAPPDSAKTANKIELKSSGSSSVSGRIAGAQVHSAKVNAERPPTIDATQIRKVGDDGTGSRRIAIADPSTDKQQATVKESVTEADQAVVAKPGIQKAAEPSAEAVIEGTDPKDQKILADPESATIAEGPKVQIEPLPLMEETLSVPFGINSNDIDAQFYPLLDQVAMYLVKNKNKFIYVRGYTDSSGSSGYNESVSRFRANAVKSYLIGKGASPGRIEVIAMGDKNPIDSNDTYEGRLKNRRVEIVFADRKGSADD